MENNQSNDYKQDEKLYIKKVKGCFVTEKKGDNYKLDCRIKQHGEKEYHYVADDDYLEYDVFAPKGSKKLLSAEVRFYADNFLLHACLVSLICKTCKNN